MAALHEAASPAPWYVRELNDDLCMSALGIGTRPDPEDYDADWPESDIVATCLLQSRPYVLPEDGRWHENAELIVAMRNAMPELMRLAKLGLAAEAVAKAR